MGLRRPAPVDSLSTLPTELLLRIVQHLPVESIARLEQCSSPLRDFVSAHDAHIYSKKIPDTSISPYGTHDCPPTAKGWLKMTRPSECLDRRGWNDCRDWKSLCKMYTLMGKAWRCNDPHGAPRTATEVIDLSMNSVWRFRVDFEERLLVNTARDGGVFVSDLDTQQPLWWHKDVRQHAHLEYVDGTAVWDCDDGGLEVWKLVRDNTSKAKRPIELEKITALEPIDHLRGFQLHDQTLVAVSGEGQAFVYDLSTNGTPLLSFDIDRNARGHLTQTDDMVLISYENRGFHFYDKTGISVGVLDPTSITTFISDPNIFHVRHALTPPSGIRTAMALSHKNGHSTQKFLRACANPGALARLQLSRGPLLAINEHERSLDSELRGGRLSMSIVEDYWGAAGIWQNWLAAISKGGRLLLCSDWRGALSSSNRANETCFIIECGLHGADRGYDLGGWVSINRGRVMWECESQIYVLNLPQISAEQEVFPMCADGTIPTDSFVIARLKAQQNRLWWNSFANPTSPPTNVSHMLLQSSIYATPSTSDEQMPSPVSFMGVYEDCIMYTYATASLPDEGNMFWGGFGFGDDGPIIIGKKGVRVVRFLGENKDVEVDEQVVAQPVLSPQTAAAGLGLGDDRPYGFAATFLLDEVI